MRPLAALRSEDDIYLLDDESDMFCRLDGGRAGRRRSASTARRRVLEPYRDGSRSRRRSTTARSSRAVPIPPCAPRSRCATRPGGRCRCSTTESRLIGVIGAAELLAALVHRGAGAGAERTGVSADTETDAATRHRCCPTSSLPKRPNDEGRPSWHAGSARSRLFCSRWSQPRSRRPRTMSTSTRHCTAANTLTVGIALTGQPFAYKRDGALRGFEIEVARSRRRGPRARAGAGAPAARPACGGARGGRHRHRQHAGAWRPSRRARGSCPTWWSAIT